MTARPQVEYPLPLKLDALEQALSWASKAPISFMEPQPYRRKEENKVIGFIVPTRIMDSELEIINVDLEAGSSIRLDYPRQEVIYSVKEFTFSIDFHSRDSRHEVAAWSYALNLQTRLTGKYIRDRWLDPYQWRVEEVGDIINIPSGVLFDNRVEGKANLELKLATCLTDRDSANIGTYFEKIRFEVRLRDQAGNLMPNLIIEGEY
jgi:hypothetical protein